MISWFIEAEYIEEPAFEQSKIELKQEEESVIEESIIKTHEILTWENMYERELPTISEEIQVSFIQPEPEMFDMSIQTEKSFWKSVIDDSFIHNLNRIYKQKLLIIENSNFTTERSRS